MEIIKVTKFVVKGWDTCLKSTLLASELKPFTVVDSKPVYLPTTNSNGETIDYNDFVNKAGFIFVGEQKAKMKLYGWAKEFEVNELQAEKSHTPDDLKEALSDLVDILIAEKWSVPEIASTINMKGLDLKARESIKLTIVPKLEKTLKSLTGTSKASVTIKNNVLTDYLASSTPDLILAYAKASGDVQNNVLLTHWLAM